MYVAMVLTVMFALPTFAAGYSPVSGSDLSVSGKAKDEYGNYKAFGASASQTTYVGSHRDGVYTYANATFTVDSNDGGYNRVYANYLD